MSRHKIGVKYGVPSVFYPRFAKFQRRIASIVPRLKNILDKSHLTQCIPGGKVQFQNINTAIKHLGERVAITVVGENHEDLQELDQQLRVSQVEAIPSSREQWATVLKGAENTNKHSPHFIVYVIDWCTLEKIHNIEGLFSSLSEDQMSNIIIFDRINNKNFLYTDVKDCKDDDLPETKHSTSISQHIQFRLETKAIELLVTIQEYVRKFVPKPGVEPDHTILDECSKKIQELLKDVHVLEDIQTADRVNYESMEIDHTAGPSVGVSIMSPDDAFKKRVIAFVGRVTKCIICDNLAKKYGLSPSMVNEFLNEGFHDYRRKYKAACMEKAYIQWHEMNVGKRANYLNYSLVIQQSGVIHDAEFYVKDKVENLNEMSKMDFEINALLRQTVVPLSFKIPKHAQLSNSLQNSLLSVPQVQGCGTIYGKLTLHVNHDLDRYVKQEVKNILEQHSCLNQYDVQLIQENVKQAGPSPPKVECGNKLQATIIPSVYARLKAEAELKNEQISKEKTGSLGCFMELKKGVTNVIDNTIVGQDSHLYAITCAHCVTECQPEVKVNVGSTGRQVNLGITETYIDDGERMDIAVIRVDAATIPICETVINLFNRDWCLYNGDSGDVELCGRVVNKRGCVTGETVGIVTSNDYRTKSISSWNSNKEKSFNFCDNYSILVGAEPGSNAEFSKSGDSGSTIYYEENSVDGLTSKVVVVSLLQGSMTHNNKYYCTYSCHLKRSLEELCNKHGYRMDYPRDVNSPKMKNI